MPPRLCGLDRFPVPERNPARLPGLPTAARCTVTLFDQEANAAVMFRA